MLKELLVIYLIVSKYQYLKYSLFEYRILKYLEKYKFIAKEKLFLYYLMLNIYIVNIKIKM